MIWPLSIKLRGLFSIHFILLYGKQAALQTSRQTDGHHLFQLDAVEAQLLRLQTACIGALHQNAHNHHSGKALGYGGRQGNACHIHVQHRDEDNIQHHIDHTGDGEEKEWAFGIACGPEDRGGEVVDHCEGDARKIDPDIYRGQWQHRLRGTHETKKGFGEQHTHKGQYNTADQRGQQGGMDRIVNNLVVALPIWSSHLVDSQLEKEDK